MLKELFKLKKQITEAANISNNVEGVKDSWLYVSKHTYRIVEGFRYSRYGIKDKYVIRVTHALALPHPEWKLIDQPNIFERVYTF